MSPRRVGVIGWGAIGRVVGSALNEQDVAGAELTCVVDNRPLGTSVPVPQVPLEEALRRCDLLVEAAGQAVVREWGEHVLAAGIDLLVASVGALTDEELTKRLLTTGPGRVYFTGGAVGGLDILQAARAVNRLESVRLTTTKLPATLEQPWMSEELRDRLRTTNGPLLVMSGSARDVPESFPRSTNVAASVALAVGDLDAVRVQVVADPAATRTSHVVEAVGELGEYRFEVRHQPDGDNAATSRIVPYSVLRSLRAILGCPGVIL